MIFKPGLMLIKDGDRVTDKYVLDMDYNPVPCFDFETWKGWMLHNQLTLCRIGHNVLFDENGTPIIITTTFNGLNNNVYFPSFQSCFWHTRIFSRDETLHGYIRRSNNKYNALMEHLAAVDFVMSYINIMLESKSKNKSQK